MIRSLFTGVTGLKQNQTRMDVLSNNIANVNTTGFKKGRVMFQDLFSQTLRFSQQSFGGVGGTNAMQVGLGSQLGSIDTLMEQGAMETTGKNTDLAIEGNGFFVVNDGNRKAYTRDGNFNINPTYDLVSANSGYKLQGWLSTQNPVSGALELKDDGIAPYTINLIQHLKKHAHQTGNIVYASNLNSGSDARDVQFAQDTLTFKDSAGNLQSLSLKFKKLDSKNWVWSAFDDTEGEVASGSFKTDESGKMIESKVTPQGVQSTVAKPYFTFDPDGTPAPASATALINNVINSGNGASSSISASGTEVKNETVTITFDGGDPTRALSYRVVGSVRGFIGSGLLGGTAAKIESNPVTFGTLWTPANAVSFQVTDSQTVNTAPPSTRTNNATISFNAGTGYSPSQVIEQMNTAFKNNGVRATAYYDTTTQKFSIVTNGPGSNKTLTLDNITGPLSDLGFSAPATTQGKGGSKPEVFSNNINFVNGAWDPTGGDVQFTIGDRLSHTALITFPDVVNGVNQTYSRTAILSTINTALASNNVAASADMIDVDNDGNPDQLVITGSREGIGERVVVSDVTRLSQLGGMVTINQPGTAQVGDFSGGGLNFTLTEGTQQWLPNETMSMTTYAAKGQADSVNIFVPQPTAETLAFSTTVNNENYQITGAINRGATHKTNITIYDSLGAPHNLITEFEHTNKDTQEWTFQISYDKEDPEMIRWLRDPGNGVVDADSPTEKELTRANDALIKNRKGTLFFSNVGKIDLAKSLVKDIEMTPLGSNPVKIDLDVDLITQFETDFTTAAREQDGYEMGLLESVYFERDGTIKGVYSNGQKQPIGQVAIALFNNPAGLEKRGKNLYDVSPNSGLALIGQPLTGERGSILPGTLEMSNVDVAEEFTNMIITQRAFQANSRVITTSDEMLQEVVNLKR